MELWARRNDKVENPERPWVKIDQRDGRDTYVYYANFDWYHYLFKDEHPSTSHSVSLSGGNSKVKYMLSGNYYSEEDSSVRTPTACSGSTSVRKFRSTSTSG